MLKKGIGSLSADEQASLLTRSSLRGLASPLFRSITMNGFENTVVKNELHICFLYLGMRNVGPVQKYEKTE